MRCAPFLGLVLGLAAGPGPSLAASPTVDQMIDALTLKDVAPHRPTRGIRDAAPAAEDQPDAPAAPTEHVTRHLRALPGGSSGDNGLLTMPVEFQTGSAGITPAAAERLSALGQALASPKLAGSRFRIEGHTDTVGEDSVNQSLSEQRAASVVSFLESRFGVSQDRLEPVGLGKKGLAVITPDQTAELRNRRVQIVNLGPG